MARSSRRYGGSEGGGPPPPFDRGSGTGAGEMTEPTDQALLEAAASGEEGAFETLYRRHQRFVLAVAARFGADGDEAFDVLQEMFVDLEVAAAADAADEHVGLFADLLGLRLRLESDHRLVRE